MKKFAAGLVVALAIVGIFGAAIDEFNHLPMTMTAPASYSDPVTPGTPLTKACRALYVGYGGDITVTTVNGSTDTIPNVADSSILPIRVSGVSSSGTTASGIRCWR